MLVLARNAEEAEEAIDAVAGDAALAHFAKYRLAPPWERRLRRSPRLQRELSEYIPAQPRVLTNPGSRKRFAIVHTGADFTILARTNAAYLAAMRDLYALDVEPGVAFPDDAMRAYWNRWNKGRPYLFLNAPFAAWKRGIEAGFLPSWHRRMDEAKKRRKIRRGDANTWYVTGKPRFWKRFQRDRRAKAAKLARMRKLKCRVVEGSDELLPLIMQGVDYGGEAKGYLRDCLLLEPSFVCEVDGEPVCWAGTHLGGSMGMIYTPPEHRRKGYAEALTALQIDHMLARDGIAVANVVLGNRASERLLATFGAKKAPGTVVWRVLRWPRWKYPKLRG